MDFIPTFFVRLRSRTKIFWTAEVAAVAEVAVVAAVAEVAEVARCACLLDKKSYTEKEI